MPYRSQIQAAAKQGFDEAAFARAMAGAVHEVTDPRITAEEAFDVVLRFAARDAELARQTERRHAVDQAEVDRLGVAALVATDLIERQAEDFSGGCLVTVAAIAQPRLHARIAGNILHPPHFHLRLFHTEHIISG